MRAAGPGGVPSRIVCCIRSFDGALPQPRPLHASPPEQIPARRTALFGPGFTQEQFVHVSLRLKTDQKEIGGEYRCPAKEAQHAKGYSSG